MKNRVPTFVANSAGNTHCVNAVFRMLFQTYRNMDLSWQDIDELTHAQVGKGTWTIGGDIALAKTGIYVENIEPVDYEKLLRGGTDYLRSVFSKQTAEYYLKHSNIENVLSEIPEFLRLVRHETRKVTIEEIYAALADGKYVGATINSSILNNRDGFTLHYVLLYDTDGSDILLHDPGLPPQPSRRITKEEFKRSFFYPGGNGGIELFYES